MLSTLLPQCRKNKAAMLETISNVIKFVTSMQLPDGRNLALEDGPMRSLFLQLMETAGVSPAESQASEVRTFARALEETWDEATRESAI
jgi:hypothetical protein